MGYETSPTINLKIFYFQRKVSKETSTVAGQNRKHIGTTIPYDIGLWVERHPLTWFCNNVQNQWHVNKTTRVLVCLIRITIKISNHTTVVMNKISLWSRHSACPAPALQSWFRLCLKASDSERCKVVGGQFSQTEFTQKLANDWSKLEAMTWGKKRHNSE